jgi:hypothetical protein
MKSRLFFAALLGATVCSGTAWAQSQPWLSDRDVGQGIGIQAGTFELHPGISAEFGYDSNYFQRADSEIEEANTGPVVGTARLRVTPSFTMRTLSRRLQEGSGATNAPPTYDLALSADLTGNVFFAEELRDEANIQGGIGADLVLLPQRPWSFDLHGDYRRIVDPSNLAGFVNSYNRSSVMGGAGITWSPGGGLFQWRLVGYEMRATLFEEENYQLFNNLDHRIETRGRWVFFPRSALVFDGQYRLIRYTTQTDMNDGDLVRARLGYNGLITNRLGFLAMGGWAASFYDDKVQPSEDYDSFVIDAELTWYLTAQPKLQPGSAPVGLSTVAIGFNRDFNNSYLGNFYRRDRGYGNFTYFVGGQFVLTLEAGLAQISYPNYSIANVDGPGRLVQEGFSEDRVDARIFGEYRPTDSIGINGTISYDQNLSKVIPLSSTDPLIADDLDFARWQAFLGARWFL